MSNETRVVNINKWKAVRFSLDGFLLLFVNCIFDLYR
jgi:hypothetical protein